MMIVQYDKRVPPYNKGERANINDDEMAKSLCDQGFAHDVTAEHTARMNAAPGDKAKK